MPAAVLKVHSGLEFAGRVPPLAKGSERISAVEVGTLVLLGIAAAVMSTIVKLNLELPGHNIIRVIFPMALGLALVPRVGAASLMGVSGTAAAALLTLGRGGGIGVGGATSLALTGVLLDVALLGGRNGRSIYLRLALAGLIANGAAFFVRAGSKMLAGGVGDGKPLALWWPKAAIVYSVCGILAGLISAAVWFRATAKQPRQEDDEAAT